MLISLPGLRIRALPNGTSKSSGTGVAALGELYNALGSRNNVTPLDRIADS